MRETDRMFFTKYLGDPVIEDIISDEFTDVWADGMGNFKDDVAGLDEEEWFELD